MVVVDGQDRTDGLADVRLEVGVVHALLSHGRDEGVAQLAGGELGREVHAVGPGGVYGLPEALRDGLGGEAAGQGVAELGGLAPFAAERLHIGCTDRFPPRGRFPGNPKEKAASP